VTTLLIDADIVAYKAATLNQEEYDFGSGDCVVLDEKKAQRDVDEIIELYCGDLFADDVIICLTDPEVNFRKQLDPTYKSNRANVEAPKLLKPIKDYLAKAYKSYIRPRLEADDVMGILSTHPTLIDGDTIIVSEDKDMRTIPAKVYHPNRPENGVMDISLEDADRFHMWQVICGDSTDGYPGCKGVGKTSVYAEEVISADREDLWDIVLEAYASKGKSEDDAILQARHARILRSCDYNFTKKKIRLWTPLCLLH